MAGQLGRGGGEEERRRESSGKHKPAPLEFSLPVFRLRGFGVPGPTQNYTQWYTPKRLTIHPRKLVVLRLTGPARRSYQIVSA